MGRLFWKTFLAFLLAQLIAGLAVLATISLLKDSEQTAPTAAHEPGPPRPPPMSDLERLLRPPPPGGAPPGPPPGPPPDHKPPGPYVPLLTTLLGCLSASALLAWYFAKPIRNLRQALRAVGEGRLDTRLTSGSRGWRDEIGDLGVEFDGMTRELERLVDAQRQLLHDVSHELRSPLARLQAAIGLARQDPSRVEPTFDRIERESARLAALVGEILTLTRFESVRGDPPASEIELASLVADVVEDARFEAQALQRTVRFEAHRRHAVMGRAEQLRRALENVLRNAVRHTAPDTQVEVSLTTPTSDSLRIQVRDHGPGVPAADLERIFEPFVRAQAAAGDGGFGLGLAIARRAIAAHRGQIRADLPAGGGLRITIDLPSAGAPLRSRAADRPAG